MERLPRKAYTYEFKMEAVLLVESGQSVAQAARTLSVASLPEFEKEVRTLSMLRAYP